MPGVSGRTVALCVQQRAARHWFLPHAHPLPAKTPGFLACLLNILCLLESKSWAEPGFSPSPNTLALRLLTGGLGWPQDATRLNGDSLPATGPHLQTTLPCLPRDGDHSDALRDCLKAISLNPCHLKAHFRLARCLFELKYVAEALECLDDFKGKFPEQAHSSACDALGRDITAALFSKSDGGKYSALRTRCCPCPLEMLRDILGRT